MCKNRRRVTPRVPTLDRDKRKTPDLRQLSSSGEGCLSFSLVEQLTFKSEAPVHHNDICCLGGSKVWSFVEYNDCLHL